MEIRHHIKNSSHFPMVNLDHHRSSPIENLDSGTFLGLLLVLWMFQKETPKPLIKSIVNDPCEDSQLSIGSQLRNGYFAEVSLRYSIEIDKFTCCFWFLFGPQTTPPPPENSFHQSPQPLAMLSQPWTKDGHPTVRCVRDSFKARMSLSSFQSGKWCLTLVLSDPQFDGF